MIRRPHDREMRVLTFQRLVEWSWLDEHMMACVKLLL